MKPCMKEIEKRKILSEVALGNIPPDMVIANGTLFNVFTREFIKKQSVWIKNGRIAYVGPDHDPQKDNKTQVIDADGMVLLPGMIEGHTHLSRSGIEEFVKHVIPSGVTTVIMETIDLGTIAGKVGMEYFVKGLEGHPIRFYYTIAPLCGLTSSEEIKALKKNELLPFLKNPKCLGIGEIYWGNIFLKGKQGERVREYASLALDLDKRIEGHAAGATGRKLQAYTCFGISSDHEPITEEEVIERLRLGYWVMIREGAIRKELQEVVGVFNKKGDFRRLVLTTDSMDPEGFIGEGYLDASLKTALNLEVPPEIAYQMVTINVAEHFRLDHLIGSLSPGKMADILMIPTPEEFLPLWVMCEGKVIFRDGKSLAEPKKVFFPDYMFKTVNIPKCIFSSNGGTVAVPTGALTKMGKVRAMELATELVTKETMIDLENPKESKEVMMLLALDRVGRGGAFRGFPKGFGLERGAYGTTMSWDTIA